jgi:uracil-DNA glycosylase
LTLWEPFTKHIIQSIDQNVQGVVFVLWGNYAKHYASLIVNNRQYIISSGHPSFASVHGKFFNTHPFSRVNQLLKQLSKGPIIW